jgi:DNA-binding GntR family transcriptional regulator
MADGVRTTLPHEIAARLRTMIFDGELVGGDRVPEQKLCERLGSSRTPLREALKILGTEGLLQLMPNRGARVTRLTADDVDEIFPVMGALEALAGELACACISEERLAEIRALHYQMAVHHMRRELQAYFQLNQRIHQAILDAAANPTLTAQYGALAARIRLARYRANMSSKRWDQAMREHEEILQRLERREGEALGQVLRRHLQNKQDTVKAAIEANSLGQTPVLARYD